MDAKPGLPAAIRVGAVALLLAVSAIGLGARAALSTTPSAALTAAGGHAGTAVVVAAEAAALAGCALLVVLLLRRPRRRKPGDDDLEQAPLRAPTPWWAKSLGITVALALIAAPFAILDARQRHPQAASTGSPAPPVTPRHTVPPWATTGTVWPTVAGIVLAVAALAVLALFARRATRGPGPAAASAQAPDDATALAASVLAGAAALHAADEPRQAIIDCYAAMERGLAEAGIPPAAADTPSEVLARAAASRLVRGTGARDLTGLFRRARYSRQPVTGTDRVAAADALARLRADLETRRP